MACARCKTTITSPMTCVVCGQASTEGHLCHYKLEKREQFHMVLIGGTTPAQRGEWKFNEQRTAFICNACTMAYVRKRRRRAFAFMMAIACGYAGIVAVLILTGSTWQAVVGFATIALLPFGFMSLFAIGEWIVQRRNAKASPPSHSLAVTWPRKRLTQKLIKEGYEGYTVTWS